MGVAVDRDSGRFVERGAPSAGVLLGESHRGLGTRPAEQIPRRADGLLQRLGLLGACSPEGRVLGRCQPCATVAAMASIWASIGSPRSWIGRTKRSRSIARRPSSTCEEVRVSASLAMPHRLQLLCELAVSVEPVGHRELEHGGRPVGSRDAHDVRRAPGAERGADRDPPLVFERRKGVRRGSPSTVRPRCRARRPCAARARGSRSAPPSDGVSQPPYARC